MRRAQQEHLGEVIRRTARPDAPAFFSAEVRGAEVYYAGRNIYQHTDAMAEARHVDVTTHIRDWCRLHHFTEATYYRIDGLYPHAFPEQLPRTVTAYRIGATGPPELLETVQWKEMASDYHSMWNIHGLDPIWK